MERYTKRQTDGSRSMHRRSGQYMKALVKTSRGPGNVEIREIEKPGIPARDWVLIKVRAAGVCGTDVHVWQDKFTYWPPVTLGHEFSGEVAETGEGCVRFKAGDRVVAEPQINACGRCEYCRSGRMHMCPDKWTLGWRTNGCMCEYIAMPEMFLHKIPEGLDLETAALCEPMAVAVYDIAERGGININDFVVVQGSGPMGILSAYMAKRLGACTVLLTGITASEKCRFETAKMLGADHILNVQKEDLHKRVMELTDGKGADCVIETSGAPSAIAISIDILKKNGRLIGLGLPSEKMTNVPWKDAILKSLDFRFSMSTSYTSWDKALCLLKTDAAALKNIITWTGSMEDWQRVFDSLAAEEDVKALFIYNT
jgi:L-iditol 2-dehydrogenase